MFCEQCGTQIEEGKRFCKKCESVIQSKMSVGKRLQKIAFIVCIAVSLFFIIRLINALSSFDNNTLTTVAGNIFPLVVMIVPAIILNLLAWKKGRSINSLIAGIVSCVLFINIISGILNIIAYFQLKKAEKN